MIRSVRKFVLTVHVISAVGWVGASAGMSTLAVIGLRTEDRALAEGAYHAAAVFDETIITGFSVLATVTGLVLALGTPWGLLRYWWVVAKFALTAGVFTLAFSCTHRWVLAARYAAKSGGDVSETGLPLVPVAAVMGSALVTATVLSIYKPWGRTPLRHKRSRSR